MEVNKKAHPNCVYAANPYHECASACLERIAQGKGRKEIKKTGSLLPGISGSFTKKKKDVNPYRDDPISTPPKLPAKFASMPQSRIPERRLAQEKKESSHSSSSSSSEDHSGDIDIQKDPFEQKQDEFSQPMPPSANHTADYSKGAKLTQIGQENGRKNDAADDIRSFSLVSPPRSHDNDESGDDDDEEEDVESVISESCVSVGKYRVKRTVSPILQSIIDKHGDVAADCKLQSASMRARYLECLCAVVLELKSTSLDSLTKVKVKEMLAVLKDLESVSINVSWLRSVLDEFARFHSSEAEKERCSRLLEGAKRELEYQEEEVAQKEKEFAGAKAHADEIRARINELEIEYDRYNEVKAKVEKYRGNSIIDELL